MHAGFAYLYNSNYLLVSRHVHIGSQMDAGGRAAITHYCTQFGTQWLLTPLNRERLPLPTAVLGAARSSLERG